MNPIYLDIGIQHQIRRQFEKESQIQLPDFFLEEKYLQMCEELQDCQCRWITQGPPNKRHIHTASTESVPPISTYCQKLLSSEPFCRLLAHVTGLDLAQNVVRPPIVDEDDSNDSSDPDDDSGDSSRGESSGDGRKVTDNLERTIAAVGDKEKNGPAAVCCVRIQQWQPGDYTLISDTDPEIGEYALDAVVYFCCDDWCPAYGGSTVYIAKDEDEELLSVSPSSNCLTLVYRDRDTLRFTKYLNHSAENSRAGQFYSMTMVYKECDQSVT